MQMICVYNNVLRMLGHIQVGTYLDGRDYVRVMEDTRPLSVIDADVPVESFTVSFCEIPKKEILFRDPWGERTHVYLITDCKLPDWFWDNKGCLELKLDNLRRVRY